MYYLLVLLLNCRLKFFILWIGGNTNAKFGHNQRVSCLRWYTLEDIEDIIIKNNLTIYTAILTVSQSLDDNEEVTVITKRHLSSI